MAFLSPVGSRPQISRDPELWMEQRYRTTKYVARKHSLPPQQPPNVNKPSFTKHQRSSIKIHTTPPRTRYSSSQLRAANVTLSRIRSSTVSEIALRGVANITQCPAPTHLQNQRQPMSGFK